MTFHIRHHTEHARAASRIPVQNKNMRPFKPDYEAKYADLMKGSPPPIVERCEPSDGDQETRGIMVSILMTISKRGRSSKDIGERVGLKWQAARTQLMRMQAMGLVRQDKPKARKGASIWHFVPEAQEANT